MKRGTPDHPKTHGLAAALGVGVPQAVGHLEILWHWTAKFAPQGDVGRWADVDIERAAMWTGEPGALVRALVASRYLDACQQHRLVVHDWHEHADDGTKKALQRKGLKFVRTTADNGGQRRTFSENGGLPLPEPVPLPEPKPEPLASEQPATSFDAPSKLTPDERVEYGRTVWEAWLARRGRGGPEMSPAEWDWLAKLMDAQVPLRIVLQGLADCRGKLDPRKPLLYARPAVEVELQRWSRGAVKRLLGDGAEA